MKIKRIMREAKLKADKLINEMYPQTDVPKYENAIKCAIIAVEDSITDLEESFKIAKELVPQCEGLISGSLVVKNAVLTELKSRQ